MRTRKQRGNTRCRRGKISDVSSALRSRGSAITAQLRARIARGDWLPGRRLPNRRDLIREFSTTSNTIQKALDALLADGLVVPHGRNGTFVAESLPHLHRIGVVFPCDPSDPHGWRRMYRAMDDEARRLQHLEQYDLRLYYGTGTTGSPGWRQLLDDITAYRLAGLCIVGMALDYFAGTPVLDSPRLRIAAATHKAPPGVISARAEAWLPVAVRTLRAAGRGKIAFVYNPAASDQVRQLQETLSTHRLPFHHNWCVPAWPDSAQAARAAAYLLLRQPATERPDAIIVGDDYLAEETTRGVQESGARAPGDVTVLSLCNYPYAPPTVTPIVRLGVNHARMLNAMVEAVLSPKPPKRIVVPLLREEEWRAREMADRTTHSGAVAE